jgi:hypothetical protein
MTEEKTRFCPPRRPEFGEYRPISPLISFARRPAKVQYPIEGRKAGENAYAGACPTVAAEGFCTKRPPRADISELWIVTIRIAQCELTFRRCASLCVCPGTRNRWGFDSR